MQLNWNVFRDIILNVERHNNPLIDDFGLTPEVIQEHIRLTVEAGLVQATEKRSQRGRSFDIQGLTMAGHEFAELVRNGDRWFAVWQEIHEKLGEDGGVTLEILKDLLSRRALRAIDGNS